MSEYKTKYPDIFIEPELDLSGISRPITDSERDLAMSKVVHWSGDDHRKFVVNIKKHPENLRSWDMPISFSEYVRRVEAGEFD